MGESNNIYIHTRSSSIPNNENFFLVSSLFLVSIKSQELYASCDPLAEKAEDCQELCSLHNNCGSWTWIKTTKKCYLKNKFGWTAKPNVNAISGFENENLVNNQVGVDFHGGDIGCWNSKKVTQRSLCVFKTSNVHDCREACQIVSDCGRWEYSDYGCYLKHQYGWTAKHAPMTSGYKGYGSWQTETQSYGADLDCNSIHV